MTMTAPVSPPPFVHLRIHSEYSIQDGTVQIQPLLKKMVEYRQPAVALTDLANVFGLIKFYKAARSSGIKPIAGTDIWIHNDQDPHKPYRLLLLVRNHQGYLNLCTLLTRAYLQQNGLGTAEVSLSDVRELKEGLFILSGGREGFIGWALEHQSWEAACALAQHWKATFPDQLFIELQRTQRNGDEHYVTQAVRLAAQCGLPVVATHPVQFLEPEDFTAHEARVCIAEGDLLANPKRVRRFTPDQYLLSTEEMCQRFADIPSALENSVRIAMACNLTLELGKPKLPIFPTPEGVSLEHYLVQLAEEGLAIRLKTLYPDEQERLKQTPEYQQRLKIECDTINSMGFAGYFLIVQDFINWAKMNQVPVGPGRGSGAGSLAAYSLGITDIDPLQYDLLFERFLNPERVSMPDFDIDFCQDNRYKVIDYVKQRYGESAVSQIATFGTMGAKAVVRDVGRVLDLPYSLCDSLSKLIPHNPADPWSLARTLKEEPAFLERYEQEEEVRSIVDLAQSLEGMTRNVGMHAGGVLIAPGKLTDFCPLYCQPGQQDSMVSQYDKDDVEAVGLVKFDFLGLRNLTIIQLAVEYVQAFNAQQQAFDIMALPLNDAATYHLLAQANTTAVFQLESRGMKELLRKLIPSNFEDIIAVLALYRPGPLGSGMVDDFVNRKHGREKAEYFTEALEPVLQSTYGVIVYQEQVMLISQIVGGYTLGGADLLRRAMGKKKPEEMAEHRGIFSKGAIEKGYKAELATTLFDLMEKFAEYGFNKSHTAAYALIAYQTAWLKAHHPAEFMAATLSSDMDDTDKVQIFWQDTVQNQVQVLPPDVNQSAYRFTPVADAYTAKGLPPKTIRYGLGALKGVGENAVEEVIAQRRNGLYTDLFDFCFRVNRQIVNRRTIESLIKAGAFDTLESNRARLLASVSLAIEAAEQKSRSASQNSLFDDATDAQSLSVELPTVDFWTLPEKLAHEKVALGFYFSAHLFDAYREEIRQYVKTPLADLKEKHEEQTIAGVIIQIRAVKTKRGKMMIVLLDDQSGQQEVIVSTELYDAHKQVIKEDLPIIFSVKATRSEFNQTSVFRVHAEGVFTLSQMRARLAERLSIPVDSYVDITQLHRILSQYVTPDAEGVPVVFQYQNTEGSCFIRLGNHWKVRLEEELIEALNTQLILRAPVAVKMRT